jgi:aspartyl-tRNA(Asn)/glutamyl-tRNA(Gln) amidotransferase subunit B
MRSKESAADYRCFPGPDIPAFSICDERVLRIAQSIPPLPAERRKTYTEQYGIGQAEAAVLASGRKLAEFFEQTASLTPYPKIAANILLTELLGMASAEEFVSHISTRQLAELATLYGNQEINSSTAKKLLGLIVDESTSVGKLVQEHGLHQINDALYLENALREVITEAPKLFEDYKSGKLTAKKAIIGRIMAKTGGRANPQVLENIWNKTVN